MLSRIYYVGKQSIPSVEHYLSMLLRTSVRCK